MRRTTISHFSFLIQTELSIAIKGRHAPQANPEPYNLTKETNMTDYITVVGAGLAGSEAAWQLAEMGIPVTLIEMRPTKQTPAMRKP